MSQALFTNIWVVAPLVILIGWLYGRLAALGNQSLHYLGSGEWPPAVMASMAALLVFNAYYIYPATFYGAGLGQLGDAVEKWHRANFSLPPVDQVRSLGQFFGALLWAILGLPVGAVLMFGTIFYYPIALLLLPVAAITALITLPAALVGLVAALHLLFVRHPAERIINPALKDATAIDHHALAQALQPEVTDIDRSPPVFVSKNQQARAEALRRKVEADGDLADEVVRRERRRAANADTTPRKDRE